MRGKGVNYDTGFSPGGESSRPVFDPEIVRREMQVIASELGCTAVRITGGEPERLTIAAERAVAAGLEVWFSPFPCELPTGQLTPQVLGRTAPSGRAPAAFRRPGGAGHRSRADHVRVRLLPGTDFFDRISRLQSPGQERYAAFTALPGKLNGFLAESVAAVRERFRGPVTYASGPLDMISYGVVTMLEAGPQRVTRPWAGRPG